VTEVIHTGNGRAVDYTYSQFKTSDVEGVLKIGEFSHEKASSMSRKPA